MAELKAHLEADGFRIDGFTVLVPVQVWDWLPSGEPFYFRERYGEVSFEVYDDGDLQELLGNRDVARRDAEVQSSEGIRAPSPSPAETEALILEFLGRYREER
ncbi:MAG: hypothetical protein M3Q23_13600 [Actinomycetota bacterium]|nr:hypothetical protein [Actinomycetota bacterium]